jgi:aspartate/methionine/tyrosine aminotransferase
MEERVRQRIRELRFSVIREMSERAADLDGVVSLGIGEPDFHTPAEVTRQAMEEAVRGRTHYVPAKGDPELVQALSRMISDQAGRTVAGEQIVITPGGMGGLSAALMTLLEPGDEVIVPEPCFPSYWAHAAMPGGTLIPLPTRYEDRFVPDPQALERAITPRTKCLLLNSPNNPTGSVIPGEILDRLARVAVRHDLVVISDEVYDQMVFDSRFESISSRNGMEERTLVVNSCSKTYAMTGWRVGYCYGPPWLMRHVVKVVNYSTTCVSSVGQRAALAAIQGDQAPFENMRSAFSSRVELVWSRIQGMQGLKAHRPSGAFYVFVDIREVCSDSTAFATDLLEKERVVVIPGVAFGQSGEGFVRIACTLDEPLLNEGMDRLERFVSQPGRWPG